MFLCALYSSYVHSQISPAVYIICNIHCQVRPFETLLNATLKICSGMGWG